MLFEENHFKLAIYLCSIPLGGFHGYLAASSRGGSVPAPCASQRVPAVPPATNLCAALVAMLLRVWSEQVLPVKARSED